MPQSVRLSDELVERARNAGKANHRSINGQIEHWVELGRMLESSSVLSIQQLQAFIEGRLSLDELSSPVRQVASRYVFDTLGGDQDYSDLKKELIESGEPIPVSRDGNVVLLDPKQDG
ncbi:TA system antitoxin ParD family protein [Mangrovitalea sediminis]|uniref:TA system antitoxin ParD family protein n=1 Tax=Mangrovitalea sediminis TaxID=1982043 RepID=UPI0013040795|nr:ParD-like family protein [Mangrovitalea sediminis]